MRNFLSASTNVMAEGFFVEHSSPLTEIRRAKRQARSQIDIVLRDCIEQNLSLRVGEVRTVTLLAILRGMLLIKQLFTLNQRQYAYNITAHRLALNGDVHATNAKSHHSEDVGKRPKAERGLSKPGSEAIFKECGVILRMEVMSLVSLSALSSVQTPRSE